MAIVIRPAVENVLDLTQILGLEVASDEKHQSWVRWIIASINKYFIDNKG